MSFLGLNIARNALLAHRAAANVTGHNIANAETPGYIRQRADLAAIAGPRGPHALPELGIGSGVEVATITRIRSAFIQARLDRSLGQFGYDHALSQGLDEVQSLFLDLTGQGSAEDLAAFFNAWEHLSSNPESQPLRLAVREAGSTVAAGISTRYRHLQDQRTRLDQVLQTKVARVNDITSEIAKLNRQITVEATGSPPNDLLNRLDTLVEELSGLIGVATVEQAGGSRDVLLGGLHLVQGSKAVEITLEADPLNNNLTILKLADTGLTLDPSGGEIAAILTVRDQNIPSYMATLDTFAMTLATDLNARHALGQGIDGSTGTDFFTATGAADIRISDDILASLDAIAASETGAVGDGNHALALSRMRDELLLSGGTETLGDFYESFVGRVGLDARLATDALDRQDVLVDDIRARRDGISGVSLDEEAINLMRFQEARNAAARLATTIDELIQTVLSIGQ